MDCHSAAFAGVGKKMSCRWMLISEPARPPARSARLGSARLGSSESPSAAAVWLDSRAAAVEHVSGRRRLRPLNHSRRRRRPSAATRRGWRGCNRRRAQEDKYTVGRPAGGRGPAAAPESRCLGNLHPVRHPIHPVRHPIHPAIGNGRSTAVSGDCDLPCPDLT